MAFLHDEVFDQGLEYLVAQATALHICSAEPTTLAEATSTLTLGNKATPTISAPADRAGGGREVTISAFADGNVTATGNASHWALVSSTQLLATSGLSAVQAVTSGNSFEITAFTIGIPDPV